MAFGTQLYKNGKLQKQFFFLKKKVVEVSLMVC